MDYNPCYNCFPDQKSLNDKQKQTEADGQKIANAEVIRVAIIFDPFENGFIYQRFTDAPPPGTQKILYPVR